MKKYCNKNGRLHRTDGPALEYADGHKEWWVNDKRHRTDGPAVEGIYYNSWFVNGKLHRLDGPAVEYANGNKEFWLFGQRIY
jgi:hypothetical protein